MNTDDWERVFLISVGCKVSEEEALKMYRKQIEDEKKYQAAQDMVNRARQAQKDQKIRRANKRLGYSGKDKAAGG